MTWRGAMLATMVLALIAFSATAARAQQWNERTILKFSEPVMIPGATLQPGAYVFQLTDSLSDRHVIEISRQDSGQNIALVQAVPVKRNDPKGDVVVKFNPTEPGTPPAMKGFFYPGSIYGHEFVYPDEQAKNIAQRTKTLVLSTDVPGSDMQKGTLRTYDAAGLSSNWVPDEAATASFESWDRQRRATATAVSQRPAGERGGSTAPAIDSKFTGQRVTVDQLEDDPGAFIGKTVSVDAEVEEVYGPRMFTIDEPHWGDLEGEILVFVPSNFAALVRDDDRITVTGTVKQFARSDFEKEWGWMDLDPQAETKLAKRPVLVASKVVGGNNMSVMLIEIDQMPKSGTTVNQPNRQTETPSGVAGTSGRTMAKPLTDVTAVARGGIDTVGRNVHLDRVQIVATGDQHGLFATSGGRTVYILPAAGERPGVAEGDTISVDGVVLQMPKFMKDRLQSSAANVKAFNDVIYVYATNVKR